MLDDMTDKSTNPPGPERSRDRRLPRYGLAGAGIIILGEALLVADFPLVKEWFTPLMWTGYVLLLDGVIRRRKGTSLLSDYPMEFFLLALISIGSWVIFEGYNTLLGNWRYLELPDNMGVRYFGYAWSFATISPGLFLTYELLDAYLPGRAPMDRPRLGNGLLFSSVSFGLACLIVPLIWPSTYMSPLVWMGFAFFLDPINGRLGDRSFLTEFFTGRFRSLLIMFLAGFLCGLLWEFWNYWAVTKWEYTVPYLGHIKVFEMPVLGFLGFLPFAVESYAIYIFVRRLIPIRREVLYLG
jgi:hypothetical protein